MFQVSSRDVDGLLRQLLLDIRFPIESNTVERHVGCEMLQRLQFTGLVAVRPVLRVLNNYNVINNSRFLNRKVWRATVDAVMNVELPLIGNEPQDRAINPIFADSTLPTDCIGVVDRVGIGAIDWFTVTDENCAANTVRFEDEWPFLEPFPLIANVCLVGDVPEIASVLDNFDDIIPSLPVSGLSLFENYAALDERFCSALSGQECV
jgi:hypothetical protein